MKKIGHHSEEPSDETLLRRYREETDQESLGRLYDRYLHLVYGLCLKYLRDRAASQDAVMDIYEVLVAKLSSHEVTHFKSWLYMVSKNHCLMLLRKTQPETSNDVQLMESALSLHPKEEPPLDQDLEALEDCMKLLKKEQQHCISMFYLERKSYVEIAQASTYPVKTVKSHIQNGKRNLKICLENHDRS